jgi:hypothetical protein
MVEGQVLDFGFGKNAPAVKEQVEKPVTVEMRYDKATGKYWIGIDEMKPRAGNKTMVILESTGVEKTSLRAPNDKGETVNVIGVTIAKKQRRKNDIRSI